MYRNSRFEFFEIVKVKPLNKELEVIWRKDAPITAKSFADDGTNIWAYSLSFQDGDWFVFEEDLESTGKFANPDDYKPVDSVRVTVLPDGSGKIIEDD